jgi:hypothetical protein
VAKIVYIKDLRATDSVDVLFIASSEADRLPYLLQQLEGKPILTVGDTEGFADRGVMINMMLVQQSLRMEVNLKALARSGLEPDSHLLRVAARIIK